tara:strand:+ start:24 stop:443 length:420 start_codon:yes stop_codon:yes gene_type:complete
MEENKGFKLKGSSLYGKINLNRGGQDKMADGRPKSSALQMHKPGHVDPDAPGTPGTPGYEPSVKSTDYLTKSKKGQPSASTDGKKRNIKAEESINDIGDEINFLEEDYNNDKVSKSQYDAKMKILREKERVALKANKAE